tara:strand:+ start:517 stop:780 length:264 start_codon:yes stop_codon:yes gene_type:complete
MSNKEINKQMEIQRKHKNTFDNIVNKTPYLKKIKDQANGLKYSGDFSTGVPDQQYKDNYDKIKWTKTEEKEKPKFRTKVNGKYTDEE